ncbi:hypothetical protein EVAR_37552_1 [Eumeta japonica]|uniref:Uncharacterized protein n=1 Tax=Eumeta variegata TaxID=151549 RepID=A0A4C1XSE9_EUMVA|nr:hypothetical protein EVAR_37552_1 [Eumeta japonica]
MHDRFNKDIFLGSALHSESAQTGFPVNNTWGNSKIPGARSRWRPRGAALRLRRAWPRSRINLIILLQFAVRGSCSGPFDTGRPSAASREN